MKFHPLLLVTGMGILSAFTSHAAIIFTDSFEFPDSSTTGTTGYTNLAATNWNEANTNLRINDNRAGDVFTTFGDQVAWTNVNYSDLNAPISNALLIGNLQAGTYTLTMHGDGRASGSQDYKFGLLASGVELGTVSGSLTTTLTALTPLVVNISAAHAQLGQDIQIKLGTNGNFQPMFDNLQLDFVAIPEPSTAALTGLAAFALVLRRRR